MVAAGLDAEFFTAPQKQAHPIFIPLQMLVIKHFLRSSRGLKILVSVVRFRPRPPFQHRSFARDCGVFVCAAGACGLRAVQSHQHL